MNNKNKFYPPEYTSVDKCMLAYKKVIQNFAERIKKSKILDVGCGMGHYTSLFRGRGNTVRGLDIQDIRSDKYSSSFSFDLYKGRKFPYRNNSFDYVVNFDVIEHIDDDKNFVNEMYRVLRKGGKALIATPNRNRLASILLKIIGKGDTFPKVLQEEGEGIGKRDMHMREYTYPELFRLFEETGFKNIKIKGCWMGIRGKYNMGINFFVIPPIAQTLFVYAEK